MATNSRTMVVAQITKRTAPLAQPCGHMNWDHSDLFEFLYKRIRKQTAAKDKQQQQQRTLSTDQEIVNTKDEIRAIQKLHKSLAIALAAEISDIIHAKEQKLRGLLDSKSRLLSLQQVGLFCHVICHLDEEALYCLEEASVLARKSRAVKDQWLFLESKGSHNEGGRAVITEETNNMSNADNVALGPDAPVLTAEAVVEQRRAFWKTALSAKRMECLACNHYSYTNGWCLLH